MNKKVILAALTSTMIAASLEANASFEPRLGGKAYYDTETNLTWTTDANINGKKSWDEHKAWAENLAIDGVNGWRLPEDKELVTLIKIFTCDSVNFFCYPPSEPFHNIKAGYWTNDSFVFDGEPSSYIFILRSLEWFAVPTYFPNFAWPVHEGDVALAIPEPEIYTMLLTGLGLLGFMSRRRKV